MHHEHVLRARDALSEQPARFKTVEIGPRPKGFTSMTPDQIADLASALTTGVRRASRCSSAEGVLKRDKAELADHCRSVART
jgi:hypothetical protein